MMSRFDVKRNRRHFKNNSMISAASSSIATDGIRGKISPAIVMTNEALLNIIAMRRNRALYRAVAASSQTLSAI